ncbi:MAG: hypothetical protein V2I33_18595, partial [Kangiellaceae bacterium]|nr:hypothetical protein [Kangiellaceae bacterium]
TIGSSSAICYSRNSKQNKHIDCICGESGEPFGRIEEHSFTLCQGSAAQSKERREKKYAR